jgi:hypothetical protein
MPAPKPRIAPAKPALEGGYSDTLLPTSEAELLAARYGLVAGGLNDG